MSMKNFFLILSGTIFYGAVCIAADEENEDLVVTIQNAPALYGHYVSQFNKEVLSREFVYPADANQGQKTLIDEKNKKATTLKEEVLSNVCIIKNFRQKKIKSYACLGFYGSLSLLTYIGLGVTARKSDAPLPAYLMLAAGWAGGYALRNYLEGRYYSHQQLAGIYTLFPTLHETLELFEVQDLPTLFETDDEWQSAVQNHRKQADPYYRYARMITPFANYPLFFLGTFGLLCAHVYKAR
jgi:hypothetical protein